MAATVKRKPASDAKCDARSIFLIGFMGAGKSSVGRALSEQLGWAFEDLDDRIEQREGRRIAEIFRDSGESGFRRAEQAALKEVMRELKGEAKRIIALGGGAFVQKHNARLLETAGVTTLFLDAEAKELWRRCQKQATGDGVQRPLLGSLRSFCELYKVRRPHYLKASMRQMTDGKNVTQIAAEVIKTLGLTRKGESRGKRN